MRCATAASLTRFEPLTSSRTISPLVLPRKTRDLQISETEQPQAFAASSAVRVEDGISRISMVRPASAAAWRTRSVLLIAMEKS